MPCQSGLKRPLWAIIKAIGRHSGPDIHATGPRHSHPLRRWQHAEAVSPGPDNDGDLAEQSQTVSQADKEADLAVRNNDRLARRAHHVTYRHAQRQYAQHEWQQKRRPDLREDWPDIFRLLLGNTPADPGRYRKVSQTARVPIGFTGFCRTSGEEFFLDIKNRTGCLIREQPSAFVQQAGGGDLNGFHQLTLYGTPRVIFDALAVLPRYLYMVHESTPDRPQYLRLSAEKVDTGQVSRMRTVLPDMRGHQPVDIVIANRPSVWNATSFTNYVRDLTQTRPRLMMRARSRHFGTTENMIVNELKSLFVGVVDFSEHITSEAVDMTLSWFCRKSKRMPVVRQIMARLETQSRYKMTAGNYEVLLAHAAQKLDVHNFFYMLMSMLARDLQPTWRSFVSLYRLASKRSSDDATVMLNALRREGVLSNFDAVRSAAADCVQSAPDSVFAGDLEQIMGHFDRLFEPEALGLPERLVKTAAEEPRVWLTSAAANKVCHRLLLQNRLADAWKVIEKLKAASERPDRGTLHLLLEHAKAKNSPALAVEVLCHMETTYGFTALTLAREEWATLWRFAWHQKCFNMSKVIWRYACMYDHVDFGLQTAMSGSLMINTPSQQTWTALEKSDVSSHEADAKVIGLVEIFYGWVAKFSVGILDDRFIPYRLRPTPPGTNPVTKERDGMPRPLSAHQQKILAFSSVTPEVLESELQPRHRLCRSLVKADMNESQYLPQRPFSQMLQMAWEKDKEWLNPATRPYGEILNLRWGDLKELEPEVRSLRVASIVQRCFERMLRESVTVPVQRRVRGYRTIRGYQELPIPEPEESMYDEPQF